jgi:biopolymer transport protein ExbB
METQIATSGLVHVWAQGDWVTRSVALVLMAMSVATWTIIILKALDQRSQRAQALQVETFWHSGDFAQGLDKLGGSAVNPFKSLAQEGREATRHLQNPQGHGQPELLDALDVSDWVERSLRKSVDDFQAKAQSGLPVLASVASTAPFVGVFGTVWGIYHALLGFGAAGQVSIDLVAGPIGEALIMTAMGLVVAIPAVLGYNALLRGNKGILHLLNRFAHDLHAYFVTGARVSSGTDSAKVVPMKKA